MIRKMDLANIFARLFFSGFFVLVIGWSAFQIHSIWSTNLKLGRFDYDKAGTLDEATGQAFQKKVRSQIGQIGSLFNRMSQDTNPLDEDGEQSPYQTDVPSVGSAFEGIELQAYGVKWDDIFRSFSKWLSGTCEVHGRLTDIDGAINVDAELATRSKSTPWFLPSRTNLDAAAKDLAVRVFKTQCDGRLNSLSDDQFTAFVSALEHFERYSIFTREGRKEDAANEIKAAAGSLKDFDWKAGSFPPSIKLAAMIRLRNSEQVAAKELFAAYRAQAPKDKEVAKFLAELEKTEANAIPAQTAKVSLAKTVPLEPGMAIGNDRGFSTICCFVKKDNDVFAVLPSFAIDGEQYITDPANPKVRLLVAKEIITIQESETAGAPALCLAKILPDYLPFNLVQSKPLFKPVEPVVGASVSVYGAASSGKQAVILSWEKGELTYTKVTSPGDAGAPIVDSNGHVLAIHLGSRSDPGQADGISFGMAFDWLFSKGYSWLSPASGE